MLEVEGQRGRAREAVASSAGAGSRKPSKPSSNQRVRHCAIYTRKSSEEGLEQSFNSLDAQREACEAYIASQKHEGWVLVPTAYDDGGLSGGTMNRPALQALLADIGGGRVDVVVVYKVDRLTRSLADFAKLTDLLDAAGASFVSVTQAFNTSTSMGRLTLNVLLSFAQFEREVAGERIRDKIAASKKRGMWMGGMPPLGYDVRDKQLVVNQKEAKTVQTIFESYLKLGAVKALKAAMDAQGAVSKARTIEGKPSGGLPISRNGYHTILKCPLYIGKTHHKGQLYPGNHKAIINDELWQVVQEQLAANSSNGVTYGGICTRTGIPSHGTSTACQGQSHRNTKGSHLLKGILFDAGGERLSPSHSTKRIKGTRIRGSSTRRYNYYVSASLMRGQSKSDGGGKNGLRLSATELDALVMQSLKAHLRNREWVGLIINDRLPLEQRKDLMSRCIALSKELDDHQASRLRERVTIHRDAITITINQQALAQQLGTDPDALNPESICITQAASILRQGRSSKLVVGSVTVDDPYINDALVDQLKLAHRWWQAMVTGKASSITDLAARERVDPSEVSRTITLAFLAPDIVRAILNGTQPPSLSPDALRRARPLPADWEQQRKALLSN
ncbi:MAG: recombinase family protein [Rhizobiales bacterium]|nr:recombinase family protein [Hyphomicrobiales bacterium]MBO6700380.1 recombinase family protein [Hyphomicrobiales bacterium]MBO6737916.1 recombinase family protein [Hyphomicrobiales bacterium]MBO6913777.1 recombinase family protein [Hyphomicrobiales bacterium]MBO6954328.1 recombinase family protein [Hyphomicrobiales bacterium]